MPKDLIKFRNWLEIELVVFIGSIFVLIFFLFLRSWLDLDPHNEIPYAKNQSDKVDFLDR